MNNFVCISREMLDNMERGIFYICLLFFLFYQGCVPLRCKWTYNIKNELKESVVLNIYEKERKRPGVWEGKHVDKIIEPGVSENIIVSLNKFQDVEMICWTNGKEKYTIQNTDDFIGYFGKLYLPGHNASEYCTTVSLFYPYVFTKYNLVIRKEGVFVKRNDGDLALLVEFIKTRD